jgi:hypothetical protein
LKDKADDIEGTEDDGVCAGLEAGEVLAIDVDDATEAEVDLRYTLADVRID